MYCYTVDGINFDSLPADKQKEKMGEWQDLLRSLPEDCEMTVTFSRKPIQLTIEGKNAIRQIEQVSIGATESISGILEALNYEATFEEHIPEMDFEGESSGYLKRSNGLSKVYVLYDMPAKLSWGWIHGIFGSCDEIRLWTKPIDKDIALRMLSKKQAMSATVAKSDRRALMEYEHAVNVEAKIIDGATRLFDLSLVCVVNGENRKDLKEQCKTFERDMRVSGASFDAIKGKQGATYYGEWRKVLSCDLSMFNVMYPFHSAEMLEVPNGVILGVNTGTNGPVIYDISKRDNRNVCIIGTSGSGKSFTAKLFTKRLIERVMGDNSHEDANVAIYIIDPMNEYYQHREYYGLDGIIITGNEQLGLDPIKILKPADAGSMLCTITKADQIAANEIMRYIDKVESIDELYKKVSQHAKDTLQHLTEGPMSDVMKGDSRFSDQMVISLKGATKKPHEILILVLILNKIWQRVVDMPPSKPKVIILDEGWLLTELPESMAYIEQIVRMGRKLNVIFVFISQKVDDIAAAHGAEGRLIDNMGTKILMRLEENAAMNAQSVMGLSEQETRGIIRFNIGEGLILTNKHRAMVKFEASAKETSVHFKASEEML